MYKAKNGIILINPETPNGWTIKSDDDILTYLTGLPYFASVYSTFIAEAIEGAAEMQQTYNNIDELAAYIAENYI